MKPLALLRTAMLLLAIGALPATAQRIDSPYRFVEHNQTAGVFGASLSTSRGPLGLGPESGPAFGARYGIGISGPFAVEVELMYSPTSRAVVDTAFNADSTHVIRGEADVDLLVAMLNIRFNLTGGRTWNRLQPFAVLGVGAAADLAGDAVADTLVAEDARFTMGTSFAGQLGAGVEYHLSPGLALRVDARTLLWKLENPTAFRLQDTSAVLAADQWENNTALTAGISIRF